VILLAVGAETRPSSGLWLQAEVLEDELLRPFPDLAGRPVLGRAVPLVEAHTDVPVSQRRSGSGGRLCSLRFTPLGRRDHRSSAGRLGDGKDVLLNREGGPLCLDVIRRQKGLLDPPVVGVRVEDEVHKLPEQRGLVSAAGQVVLTVPGSGKKTEDGTDAVVPGCDLSLGETCSQEGVAELMHGGRLRQLLFYGEDVR